jgi:hypothetical protein
VELDDLVMPILVPIGDSEGGMAYEQDKAQTMVHEFSDVVFSDLCASVPCVRNLELVQVH